MHHRTNKELSSLFWQHKGGQFGLWWWSFKAAVALLCLWGMTCHCLCGQTLFLLERYYNTASASSDPWKLPSIEMNHTDGLCNSTELPIHHTSSMYRLDICDTGLKEISSELFDSKIALYVLYRTFENSPKAQGFKLLPGYLSRRHFLALLLRASVLGV